MISTPKCVYWSLIYHYFTYSCAYWGNNYNVPPSKVVKLQNKGVRIILDVLLTELIISHYTALGLLKVPDVFKLSTSFTSL